MEILVLGGLEVNFIQPITGEILSFQQGHEVGCNLYHFNVKFSVHSCDLLVSLFESSAIINCQTNQPPIKGSASRPVVV